MSVRELFVSSKEIRSGILEAIRLKNVKAVLLGKGHEHHAAAHWKWPRTEGILIKIDVEVNGRTITAIVDTGSQLDVVRADIAALKVNKPVDMNRTMNMNDANGGQGQLQGYIQDVEFNCGGVITSTDLWMSQQAPFELLLGRPWQRGNMVSIDERDEGTYLVFKDRHTRQPRYELLAIPYELAPDVLLGDLSSPMSNLLTLREDEMVPAGSADTKPSSTHFSPNDSREKPLGKPSLQRRWKGAILVLAMSASLLLWTGKSTLTGYQGRGIGTKLSPGLNELSGTEKYKRSGADSPQTQKRLLIPPNFTNLATPTRMPPTSLPKRPSDPSPSPSNKSPPQPARPSLLSPLPCDVLSRDRSHYFGRVDVQPHGGNALARVRAAANSQWAEHRRGQELEVRPGSVVSPQTLYTGVETRPNGQEVHHAIFLNAPPLGDQPWEFEVPYSSASQIQTAMSSYSPAVQAEIERLDNTPEGIPRLTPPPSSIPLANQPLRTFPSQPYTFSMPPLPPFPALRRAGAALPAAAHSGSGNPPLTTHTSPTITEPARPSSAGEGRPNYRPDTPYPLAASSLRKPSLLSSIRSSAANEAEGDAELRAARVLMRLKSLEKAPPAGNSRLERLQYEARRCARATEVDADGLPRYVCGVYRVPGEDEATSSPGAARRQASSSEDAISPASSDIELVEVPATTYDSDEDAEDVTDDEGVNEEGGSQEVAKAVPGSEELAEPAVVAGKHRITRDYFNYSPSPSSACYSPASPAPHLPTRANSLSPILVDDDVAPLPSPVFAFNPPSTFLLNSSSDPSRPIYIPERDCRSTRPVSPPTGPGSDNGSMPALSDVSSDSGHSDYGEATVPHPILPLPKPISFAVVDKKQIHENIHFMSRHYLNPRHAQNQIHLVWIQMDALSQRRAQILRDTHAQRNQRMTQPLLSLLDLFEHSKSLLEPDASATVDIERMEKSSVFDSNRAEHYRVQEAESTIEALLADKVIHFTDGTSRIRDGAYVAVARDGQRVRELSDEAWLQTPMYRGALGLLAELCPEDIACATVARALVGEFTQLADTETLVWGWDFTITDLHQTTQAPPPYLFPKEYAHLRLLLYVFAKHDQLEVVEIINTVLNYRFRKAAVINHFLHGGLLELNDAVPDHDRLRRVEARATLPAPDPTVDLQTLKTRADFFLQARFRSAGRATQNWVPVGAN
ncbi:hypothetical protein C8R47DRAFT_1210714 [Mycena vitilis]|nr:hypothetical protein C8R47DRAFT_1210714 [Mycena vitilis]